MRIAIVTDAWTPQVNGVVRTLEAVTAELRRLGHDVLVVSPDAFRSVPCPTYPEIRLAVGAGAGVGRMLAKFAPDAIHLATEGPLCLAARRFCLVRKLAFTTAYHTQFPDYVCARTGLPTAWVWKYIRWFHAPAAAVLASTPGIRRTLSGQGIRHLRPWGRGVDLACFTPAGPRHPAMAALPGPVLLSVGRVAVEKNVEAFLACPHPGTKVVVGDGPALPALRTRFPDALFLGPLFGETLASAYRAADAFVFPSRTDTFGLVMIEAIACGTPVAAYPVTGPADVLDAATGAMDADLDRAIARALTLDRGRCGQAGAAFTWEASARQFLDALAPIPIPAAAGPA